MVSFDGGSASKVDDVTALRSRHKMADMCYYGNVMTTTRWWLCVTILHLQQYSHRLNLSFFTDEAWFHLSGYVNSQNTRIWAAENPHSVHKKSEYVVAYLVDES